MDSKEATKAIIGILSDRSEHPPAFQLWDGERIGPSDAPATVVLRHPGALRALLIPLSDLTAGEAYVYDDVDIEGDIFAVLNFGFELVEGTGDKGMALSILRLARKLPRQNRRTKVYRPRKQGRLHSIRRDREDIRYHYDVGNDFYQQFLDPLMVYSSAAFLDASEPLEVAQRRKLDVICRKLQLQPGQRLLDVGCGWGALVTHAVRNYGVEAVGITLSSRQAAWARDIADRQGLSERITILERDYREIEGAYDAIASVGMFEHVGRVKMRAYFERLRSLLTPGGVLLNHGIGTRDRDRGRMKPTFVSTYVFPDGELLPIEEVIGVAERVGFELRDLESLRTSYALTLRQWVTNLERNRVHAVAAAEERVYRIWRAFMAGSALSFEKARISVYQLLLADPGRPWTYGRAWMTAADDEG
ncbi:MAG: class I SAM-dependent methyltransferase [Actinobacteria bacterium]|nr:class I SAM-dependent methyltransferase [Actinomycetota bacterium]